MHARKSINDPKHFWRPALLIGLKQTPQSTQQTSFIKDSDTMGFVDDVITPSHQHFVLVDFWADWCQPCKQLTPTLESIISDYKGAITLVKINVDDNQQLAAQLRIQSLPTVMLFKDGRPVDGFAGNLPKNSIEQFLSKYLEAPAASLDDIKKQAFDAFYLGNISQALQAMNGTSTEDKELLLLKARCYLMMNDEVSAKEVFILLKEQNVLEAEELQKAFLDLYDKNSQSDVKKTVDPFLKNFQFENLLDELLKIVSQKSDGQDDAKDLILKTFMLLSPSHPLAIEKRKQLSRILFS